jgi:Zinc finger, C2H2 type
MRGSSNTIECGYCGKTIEYLNARMSGSQGKLVCFNCDKVPSIPKPPVDPLYGFPIEDFTPPYAIPIHPRPNSKSNFLNQRVGQAFNPQIMNTPSPVRYRSPSPLLPDLHPLTRTTSLLSPIPNTPIQPSPIHSPTPNSPESMEIIPIAEALAAFGLGAMSPGLRKSTPEEAIDLDALMDHELERIGPYTPSQQSYRAKSRSPRVTYQSPGRNRSPQPSTSSGMPGLNTTKLGLPPHYHGSDSDIDNPLPMKSPETLKGYLTNFHDCDNTHCKSITHHPTRRKTLKTKAERTKVIRNRISGIECSVEGCNHSFVSIKSLWRHQDIVHRKIKPFKCTTCGKDFARSDALTVHKRTHTGEKPYQCTTCGKGFAHNSTLTVHNRSHTGEKPFTCNICDKGFVRNRDLKNHNRIHTVETPFKC